LAILAFRKKTQQSRQKKIKVESLFFVVYLIVLWMRQMEEDSTILFHFSSSSHSGFLYYSSFFSCSAGQSGVCLSTCSSSCFGSLSLGIFENGISNHQGGGTAVTQNDRQIWTETRGYIGTVVVEVSETNFNNTATTSDNGGGISSNTSSSDSVVECDFVNTSCDWSAGHAGGHLLIALTTGTVYGGGGILVRDLTSSSSYLVFS
jgi:hypothetical protein